MDCCTFSPEAVLRDLRQDGRPLENYVEEFVGVCYRVSWSDQALNLAFVAGLDDILLVLVMLPDADEYRLEDFVNRVLQATGSEFCVGVTDEDLSGGRPVSVTGQGFVPAHLGSTPHSSTTQQREQVSVFNSRLLRS
ncbi:hypothetical protein E1301_Tti006524 [Triplophysa tibetana]|uniref:Uncharacterized protein n=1 Tax=Triplophysa tibetana TaxID=1572043 RepID=A0A5A9PCL1_9TELE|nr:hypothetical protein E1301_Tti006524 [Triplophysa tibetana]